MLTRRATITGTAAAVLMPGIARAEPPPGSGQAALKAALNKPDTLAYYAAKAEMLFGSFVNGPTRQDAAYMQEVIRECSLINAWGTSPHTTRKSSEGFDFRFSDPAVALARSNNLAVCGGYLATWDNIPKWIEPTTDRQTALAEMQLIIRTTMNHYRAQFYYWIVVNEAIALWNKNPYGLRSCAWRSAIGGNLSSGTNYIAEAFKAARATDPSATLVYADYGLEDGDDASGQKRAAVLALLSALKRENLVDSLGIQGHLSMATTFDARAFRSFLDSVSGLGLNIVITELDVNDAAAPSDIPTRDAAIAQKYAAFLTALLSHPGVESITAWGLSDRGTWLNASRPRPDGLPQRGDLIDDALARKPAYNAVKAALQVAAR